MLAATLVLTAWAPLPAEAAGVRMKGMPGGGGAADEKYMNALDKKKLQSSRRKAALAQKCAQHPGRPVALSCHWLCTT